MLTFKLHISSNSDYIIQKQSDYSFAFHKLYSNFQFIKNTNLISKIKKKYNLSNYEMNCLIIDAKTKYNQTLTWKTQTENKIIDIATKIETLKSRTNPTLKERRILSILYKKQSYFNKLLSKNIVFGSKKILQKLSYLNNDKNKNLLEIQKYKFNWIKNRLLPINYIGSKHDSNSNRYFIFDFENKTIIYKPSVNIKVEVKYTCSPNRQKQLLKLQEIKDLKLLPISIKLSNDYIFISYDEEILNGFGLDETSRKQEISKINTEHIDKETKNILIKKIYKKYYTEQEQRKLKNKIPSRYLSIDLNPLNIGCSILDKINDNEFKIIKTWNYDLSNHSTKLRLSSIDKNQKYQNNKRKFEIYQIIKQIFKIAISYKVSYFVIEELDFKQKSVKNSNTEFNRQTKNLWYRTIIENSITKHCNEIGIIKLEINPVYSSFIGNIKYNYIDSINASIEIGRRGLNKFKKNDKLLPTITQQDIDTMSNLIKTIESNSINQVRDVQFLIDGSSKIQSWKCWYNLFKTENIKYRLDLKSCKNRFQIFSMNSKKSKVIFIDFYYLCI